MAIEYFKIIFSTTIVYFFIIFALRLFGKKELAQLTTVDLVFILLISNAVQNAMVGPNNTLMGGIIAAATLFVWNYILKLLLYKFNKLDILIQGNPILLIYKGFVRDDNMRKAKITFEELYEAIREHGVDEIKSVDLAMLERDGNISVLSDSFKKQTIKKRKIQRAIKQNNQ
ncbi:MAG: DUF421 domain-containing protein [Sebaldella sp.]|nr:DUF421 domain-containing protein [Sebaldella sp.]